MMVSECESSWKVEIKWEFNKIHGMRISLFWGCQIVQKNPDNKLLMATASFCELSVRSTVSWNMRNRGSLPCTIPYACLEQNMSTRRHGSEEVEIARPISICGFRVRFLIKSCDARKEARPFREWKLEDSSNKKAWVIDMETEKAATSLACFLLSGFAREWGCYLFFSFLPRRTWPLSHGYKTIHTPRDE